MFLRVQNRVPDFEGRFEDLKPGDVSLNIFCGVEARRAEFGEGVDELRIGDLFFSGEPRGHESCGSDLEVRSTN